MKVRWAERSCTLDPSHHLCLYTLRCILLSDRTLISSGCFQPTLITTALSSMDVQIVDRCGPLLYIRPCLLIPGKVTVTTFVPQTASSTGAQNNEVASEKHVWGTGGLLQRYLALSADLAVGPWVVDAVAYDMPRRRSPQGTLPLLVLGGSKPPT